MLHNRKLSDPGNETQGSLLKYYEEQILGENDGCEEAFAVKQALEDEELAVKQALEAETEQCRLMFISENCSIETTKYNQGLSLWQRYGLSEAQYIANQIYLADCALLDAYHYSYNDVTGLNPAQVQKLKARIIAFEQQQILEQQAEAEAEDANDWWVDERFKQKDMDLEEDVDVVEDDVLEELEEEELEEDMEQVDLDEWLENKREEDFESWKQEMIDRDA